MTFFGLSTKVSWVGVTFLGMCDLFWGIRLKCLPENWFESTHDLRSLSRFNSWLKWLFMELTENQLTKQADPQVLIQIDSWLKRLSRYLTQNQLIAQADPQVLNQFDSSLKQKKKQLILSLLMIQLWVVPMSDMSTMHCCRNASGDTRY